MTFSIVACDLKEETWGIAVASKFLAVGAVVPWAQAEVGAVATQSFANTSFGPRGLEMMALGLSAEETLAGLLQDDPERELRQVGLVDKKGGSATYSGNGCFDWAGGVKGKGYAIQGNILAGAKVVSSMEKAFLKAKGDLPTRLYTALYAGDRAGGDKRGRQSAAIYVAKTKAGYGGFNDRWIDYREDDHEDPVVKLGELIQLHQLYFGKSPASERIALKGNTLKRIQKILKNEGYMRGTLSGKFDEKTKKAFTEFIGNENFEERSEPSAGWVDGPVLKYLFKKFER
jgi:uncharacterized Ntn-hydrolase superfamily protein